MGSEVDVTMNAAVEEPSEVRKPTQDSLQVEQEFMQGDAILKPGATNTCVSFDSALQTKLTEYSAGQGEVGASVSNVCTRTPTYVQSVMLQDTKDRKFKHKRRSLWYRLRHRKVHMGVVEVNGQHPYYFFLKAISCGVATFLQDPDRLGPMESLEDEHYQVILSEELTLQGVEESGKQKHCVVESYAPAVFATIRRSVEVEENSYMETITCQERAFLEFISNSRSGQDFFLSSDMRYLIKTNNKRDVMFLLSILEEYLQHFLSYPHSLLVKYLGCYSVQFAGKKKLFFLVMQNVFYPPDRIEDRFDIKGCTAGRYQQPDPPGSHTITVLKDQNFLQEHLQLGSSREWFIDQITADSTFLKNLNVMDYSILIGRHKLSEKEQYQGLPELVSRITKSKIKSSTPSTASTTSHTSVEPTDQHMLPGAPQTTTSVDLDGFSVPKKGVHFPHSLQSIPDTFADPRRRLLPLCPNALHIIEGPEYRYFLGIVDFLTRWTLKRKVARLWKIVKYGCGEHSTMPPDYYSQRFLTFLSKRVR
ncbi:phosphatidylinositol 4-phosphate 5-kinase-like protein 1 [Littorina saxatilis]|uniref:phosphatidylinositol 4-phosphate 5-kinase-like protein 1 n=1 Tax=Littorina saxatilis TaxID=31220 RepID=UPI0038B5CD90